MRVLLLCQHYAPETGAPPNRMASIVRGLRAEGHEVAVVTAVPNHPEGEVYEGYRKRLFVHEERDGVSVVRTWVYASPTRGFVRRLANYLSFMVMSVWGALRHQGRFDVVLASSPPLFVGLAGWMISVLKRAKFVFDVRDLWPEVAIAMGELKNPLAIRAARALERFLYARADGVTAVTESFCRTIQKSLKRPIPVARVMNGTDPEVFRREAAGLWMRKHLELENRFLVGYVGNLGLAQGLDHVLDAAAWLRRNEPNALFLLVGSGPVKERLEQAARARNLLNVLFFPRVTQDEAAVWMCACDALLVPLGRHPIYESFIPSKLFDSMAAGRPVLLSVPGEAARVLGRAGAGMNYVPEDGAGLAECVQRLVRDPLLGDDMGARGRAYASEVLTRDAQAQVLVQFLEHVHGQTMVVDEYYSPDEEPAPALPGKRRRRAARRRTRIQR